MTGTQAQGQMIAQMDALSLSYLQIRMYLHADRFFKHHNNRKNLTVKSYSRDLTALVVKAVPV